MFVHGETHVVYTGNVCTRSACFCEPLRCTVKVNWAYNLRLIHVATGCVPLTDVSFGYSRSHPQQARIAAILCVAYVAISFGATSESTCPVKHPLSLGILGS